MDCGNLSLWKIRIHNNMMRYINFGVECTVVKELFKSLSSTHCNRCRSSTKNHLLFIISIHFDSIYAHIICYSLLCSPSISTPIFLNDFEEIPVIFEMGDSVCAITILQARTRNIYTAELQLCVMHMFVYIYLYVRTKYRGKTNRVIPITCLSCFRLPTYKLDQCFLQHFVPIIISFVRNVNIFTCQLAV